MLKTRVMSLTGLLILVILACGAAAPPEEAPTAPVAATSGQVPTAPPAQGETLEEAAPRLAGGPGAIYVGDLSLMAAPSRFGRL